MSQALTIDVWSDIACPWCWVGKRHLEEALREFDGETELRWHAFELNPSAPQQAPEHVDYAARLAEKYGTDRDGAQEMIDRMVGFGRTVGLDLRFDRIRPSNTFDAHRLIAWAGETGRATDLKELLFKAYLQEGRSVSDHDQLTDLAVRAGLESGEAAAVLSSEMYGPQVRADEQAAVKMGISGVPFFVLGGHLGVSGARPAEVLVDAMRRAHSAA